MKDELIDVLPDASRIMEGLRDTGYEFNTAIADIVDNSIAADATVVAITMQQLFTGEIKVMIADNGNGMDRDELIAAMRYGAPQRKDKHSLGKFGLGLKTASTSCCRKLKVFSRKPGGTDGICATWDLDRIAKDPERRWSLILGKPEQTDIQELNAYAGSGTGTLVVWEKCDRILSARYKNPSTKAYREAIERIKESLRFHLSMTFQRFLDPDDARARNVEILLDGKKLEAWDPFCRELVEDFGTERFSVECEDGVSYITVTPYIVPQKEEYVTTEEKQRIMPAYKNDALRKFSEEAMSGFYVYRENRLIHWGEWFGMPGVDFHTKLLRFELSFDSSLDDDFQVDVKKSRILLDEDLRKTLLDYAAPFKAEANKRYRRRQTDSSAKKGTDVHSASNTVIKSAEATLVNPNNVIAVSDSEAQISNRFGVSIAPYSIHDGVGEGDIFVETVEDLRDNLLWNPALIDKKRGVQLNANHEFYKRFYANNRNNQDAILAMDYVFYALAQAETDAYGEEAMENLEEARYQASRQLRRLAKFLPDASIEDIEGVDE